MFISIFGYLFIVFGFLFLVLPLLLVELSRPRDWLMGGLFLFLGLFLIEENDVLRGSINLFVISMAFLFGKMIQEISQTRWYQLSGEEKNRIGSLDRWLESFKQIGRIFVLLGKDSFDFFKSLKSKAKKSVKEKKWIHPQLKQEIQNQIVDSTVMTNATKISSEESIKNEETS